jgi:Zn-dependent oligopeptidase
LLDLLIHLEKTPKSIEKLDEKILKIVNKYSLFERKSDYKMYLSFSHIFD